MEPSILLLTFRTYGTWLHGDARGSVDRAHNVPGTPRLPPNPARERSARRRMTAPPCLLGPDARRCVGGAFREVAAFRGWRLHAFNVRTTHAHLIAELPAPERDPGDFKRIATRNLRRAGLVLPEQKVWAEGWSAVLLPTQPALLDATRYVLERQGEDLPGATGGLALDG